MRIILLLCLLLICSCASKKTSLAKSSNTLNFKKITVLPEVINESSGLVTINGDLITLNDSGGGAYLYRIDTLGNLLQTYKYELLSNTDWEALTLSNRYLHIADMGNNRGNRKDLKLYNILLQDLDNDYVEPDVTTWSYDDQTDYSIRPQKHAHDAEATIFIKDKFYIFSKNWMDFSTSIYAVKPDQDSPVKPIQSIDVNGLITDATFNGKNRVVLCGYNQSLSPFIVELDYQDGKFTFNSKTELPLEGAQLEAITYHHTEDDQEVYYLTSEAVNTTISESEEFIDGELYQLKLPVRKE